LSVVIRCESLLYAIIEDETEGLKRDGLEGEELDKKKLEREGGKLLLIL
jgi:hypothetical protein